VFRNLWVLETKARSSAVPRPAFPDLSEQLQKRMKAINGLLHPEFALVHTLPFDEWSKFAEGMHDAGYRPVRLRPFVLNNGQTQVAALFQRDGLEWKQVSGNAVDAQSQAEQQIAAGLWPIDVAGYAPRGGENYIVLFARLPENPADEARVYCGVRHIALRSTFGEFPNRGLAERVDQVVANRGAGVLHSLIWWKSSAKTEGWFGDQAYYEARKQGFQLDVCLIRNSINTQAAYSWCALAEAPPGAESTEVHGISVEAHLKRCHELVSQGWRPVAIGAAQVNTPPVMQACSGWHRTKE
jgi:hypothetical protein